MARRAPASMSMPRFAHTVVLQCCDPVTIPLVQHTNSRRRADALFAMLRAQEIAEGGGGEFTVTQYAHTADSQIATLVLNPPDPDLNEGRPFVYDVRFPGSEVVAEFSYMDLMELPTAPTPSGPPTADGVLAECAADLATACEVAYRRYAAPGGMAWGPAYRELARRARATASAPIAG